MRRRALLASLFASPGLAGCLRGQGSRNTGSPTTRGDGSPDDEVRGSRNTGPPATVDTRSAIGYWHGDDSYTVDPPEAGQFAFVDLPGDGGSAPLDAFTLELGSRTFSPREPPGNGLDMPGVGAVYGVDGSGPLLFDIPTVDADEGALVGDDTRYPLPDDGLSGLSAAAAFEVESVSVPGTVATTEPVDVALTVTNRGDAPGGFFAAVRWNFEVQGFVRATVQPGETATAEASFAHEASSGSL